MKLILKSAEETRRRNPNSQIWELEIKVRDLCELCIHHLFSVIIRFLVPRYGPTSEKLSRGSFRKAFSWLKTGPTR